MVLTPLSNYLVFIWWIWAIVSAGLAHGPYSLVVSMEARNCALWATTWAFNWSSTMAHNYLLCGWFFDDTFVAVFFGFYSAVLITKTMTGKQGKVECTDITLTEPLLRKWKSTVLLAATVYGYNFCLSAVIEFYLFLIVLSRHWNNLPQRQPANDWWNILIQGTRWLFIDWLEFMLWRLE